MNFQIYIGRDDKGWWLCIRNYCLLDGPVTVNPFFLCWRTSGAKVCKSAHQLVLVLVLGTDLEAYPNQADVSTKTQVSNCEVHIVFASLKHMLFLVLMKKEWLLWFLLMLRPTFPTLGLASMEYPHPTIQPPEGNPRKIFGESEIEVPFSKISDIFFWKKKRHLSHGLQPKVQDLLGSLTSCMFLCASGRRTLFVARNRPWEAHATRGPVCLVDP